MVILDSNIWIACLDRNDSTHDQAVKLWSELENRGEQIKVPEYVLLETTTMINRLAGKSTSDTFLDFVIDNDSVEIIPSSPEFLSKVIKNYLTLKTKDLSFVDVALLVLSAEIKVLTFDSRLKKQLG